MEGESFVTAPTGKPCFVFALRVCVRRDARSVWCLGMFVSSSSPAAPAAASFAVKQYFFNVGEKTFKHVGLAVSCTKNLLLLKAVFKHNMF